MSLSSRPGSAVLLVVGVLAVGCGVGADPPPASAPPPRSTSPVPEGVPESTPIPEPSAQAEGAAGPQTSQPPPRWLSVKADYPRYLHHLRRLNLETVNLGPVDLIITEHVLRAGHFEEVAPEADRLSTVWAGSQVDIQSDFGDVVSCEDPGPFEAWVEYEYTTGEDPAPARAVIPIDPAPLDEIRDRECAQQVVLDTVDVRFGEASVDGSGVTASVVLERNLGEPPVTVVSMLGSVIFTMSPAAPHPERAIARLGTGEESATVPVVFEVARCDPHAVGQSTKTYEFNLWVAVGGRPSQAVAIPVDPGLRAALDEVLAACLATATSDG